MRFEINSKCHKNKKDIYYKKIINNVNRILKLASTIKYNIKLFVIGLYLKCLSRIILEN